MPDALKRLSKPSSAGQGSACGQTIRRGWKPVAALLVCVAVSVGVAGSASAENTLSVCSSCAFTTIQSAIDAASSGDTITVGAGTYAEQLTDTISLTLVGSGAGSTFIAPTALTVAASSGLATILTIGGSASVHVEISGFTLTGPVPNIDSGIFVRDGATADIHDNALKDIRVSAAPSGSQQGLAIRVGRAANTTTGIATIANNVITGYQKGGIVVDNAGSRATVTGNTVTGWGPTAAIGQNGIQISRGATATLTGNTVSGNDYTPTSSISTGVLLFQPGAVTIGSNTLSADEIGLYTDTQSTLASIDVQELSGGGSDGRLAVADPTGWSVPATTEVDAGLTNAVADGNGSDIVSAGGRSYVFGYSASTTVEAGIAAVAAGGTVNVAAGAYSMSSTTVSKAVTMLGPNAGVDGRGSNRSAEATITPVGGTAIRVTTTDPVVIDGLAFGGATTYGSLDSYTSGADITLRNSVLAGSAGHVSLSGGPARLTLADDRWTGVSPDGNTDTVFVAGNWNGASGTVVSISDSEWGSSPAMAGLNLGNVSGSIAGNTFSGLAYYGILVANGSGSLSITGNVFDGITNPAPATSTTYGAGVRFYNPAGSGPVTITGNRFSNSYVGIGIRPNNSLAGLNTQITGNRFAGNNSNIRNDGSGAVVVPGNYWGAAASADVAAGITGSGAGLVAHTPWCSDSGCATSSDDTYLTGLSVGGSVVSLSSSTTSYGVDVVNDVTGGIVQASVSPGATVAVGGAAGWRVGANTVTIAVTSADGTAHRSYVVNVSRAAAAPAGGPQTAAAATPPATVTIATVAAVADAPMSAPATPGDAGVVTVTMAAPAAAPGAVSPVAVPVTVAVSWAADVFGDPMTVTLTPAGLTSSSPLGAPVIPGAPVEPPTRIAGGFTLGAAMVQLVVTDAAGGRVTAFDAPLVLHISSSGTGEVPAYSHDGKTWTTIPKLSGPSLPPGQQDGYFVNADGSTDIYTRHATYFGLLVDAQAPTAPTLGVQLTGHALRFAWHGAKDNVHVSGYRLVVNGHAMTSTAHAVESVPARAGRYQVVAIDTAGNTSARSATITVAPKVRPATAPRQIPGWATRLVAWQSAPRAGRGARPAAAPRHVPSWYASWAAWHNQPLHITA